jgi:preprotein translocase subunit SecG
MTVLLIIHLIVTLSLIGVILLQHSEGGLGSMSGQNGLFTARGGSNVLTKATWVLASLFIGNCLLMTFLSSHHLKSSTSFLGKDASHVPAEPVKSDAVKSDTVKSDAVKSDAVKTESSQPNQPKK